MTYCATCKVKIEASTKRGLDPETGDAVMVDVPARTAVLVDKTVYCLDCYNKFPQAPWIESALREGDYKSIKVLNVNREADA